MASVLLQEMPGPCAVLPCEQSRALAAVSFGTAEVLQDFPGLIPQGQQCPAHLSLNTQSQELSSWTDLQLLTAQHSSAQGSLCHTARTVLLKCSSQSWALLIPTALLKLLTVCT